MKKIYDIDDQYRNEISKHFLFRLFFPRSIAVVGASPNPNMGVSQYLETYKNYKYGIGSKPPNIYPINPKYDGQLIFNLWRCYKNLKSIPEPIDIVISCINAKYVPNLYRECVEVEAKFLVIYTSGFSEVGERGITYTNELKKNIKNSNNMTRVLGPNCFGSANSQINLNFNQFAKIVPGCLSVFSQSGGFANRIVENGEKRGLGFNFIVSVGNMIDLDMNDFIDFFSQDTKTNVMGFYLETVKNKEKGQLFLKNLKKVNKEKPVIILKGGQTELGARTTISHTGSIAGSSKIYNAVFKQTGVINVETTQEFHDTAYFLSKIYPNNIIKGRKTCLIVPGGGNAVEMVDLLHKIGLEFPEIKPDIRSKLSKILNDVNIIFDNPIDTGALGILPEMLLNTAKIVLHEDFDLIIIVIQLSRILKLPFGHNKFAAGFARSLGRMRRKVDKTFIVIPMVYQDDEITCRETRNLKRTLDKYNILHFQSIDRLAKSLKYYFEYRESIR